MHWGSCHHHFVTTWIREVTSRSRRFLFGEKGHLPPYWECGRAQAHSPSFVYDATVLSGAGDEQLVFNGARASVWEDENVLEIDGGECS